MDIIWWYNHIMHQHQGNTIFPNFSLIGATSGLTNPNTFNVNGVYWNVVDNTSV
jgi:hypothetical protein